MDSVEQYLRWDFPFEFSRSELLSSDDLIFAFDDLIFVFGNKILQLCTCTSQFTQTLDACRCNLIKLSFTCSAQEPRDTYLLFFSFTRKLSAGSGYTDFQTLNPPFKPNIRVY